MRDNSVKMVAPDPFYLDFFMEKQAGATKDNRSANSTKGAGGPPGM